MQASAEFLLRQYLLLTQSLFEIADGNSEGDLQPLLDERDRVLDAMNGLSFEECQDLVREAMVWEDKLLEALKSQSAEAQKLLVARVRGRKQLKGYAGAEARATYGQQV